MLLWIISDLHLECARGWDLPAIGARPAYDVMVVAGDLITRMERGVRWLADRIDDRPVIYVPGNHEFYGTDIDRTVEKARDAARGTNIHVMQDDVFTIDGVTFVGATLWTDFALFDDQRTAMAIAGSAMNDFRFIGCNNYECRLRPSDTLRRNAISRAFFSEAIAHAGAGPIVAVTHHGPAPQSARAGTERAVLTAAYVNADCSELLHGVDLWIHGHCHETRSYKVCGTRVVTNAKGYGLQLPHERGGDNPNFDSGFVVEI